MTAAHTQMALGDDVGTTLLLSRMDSHAQKQPVGSPLNSQNDTPLKSQTTPLTSASSPSLSLMPPPLPQRDARRNSCFLDALLDSKTKTQLATDGTATPVANTTLTGPPTPLDVYMSSEEDASSMGELSDFDFDDDELDDFDGEYEEATATTAAVVVRTTSNNSAPAVLTTDGTTSSSSTKDSTGTAAPTVPMRRHSHDVARAVSVIYVGKPSLVDLGLEREARRRSLHNGRSASSSSSSVALSETRPSTSSGGSMLSTAPSSTVSPAKQHKRNSSSDSIGSITGSITGSGMMASLRARKLAMTAAAASVATSTVTLGRSLAPVLTSLDTSMPPPPSPTAQDPVSATTSTAVSAPIPTTMAPPSRSFTTSALMVGQAASAASSPRTPTFGTAGLLRGMTRSLTLSRRGLSRRESTAETVPTPTSATATSPVLLPAMLPAETVSALLASSGNPNSAGNRKSLAMSVVSSMTSMNAPPPGPPNEDGFEENDNSNAPARRVAMPPAEIVVSKKGTGSSFLGSLAGRRRSMKLL